MYHMYHMVSYIIKFWGQNFGGNCSSAAKRVSHLFSHLTYFPICFYCFFSPASKSRSSFFTQSGIDGGGFKIVTSQPDYLYAQFEPMASTPSHSFARPDF